MKKNRVVFLVLLTALYSFISYSQTSETKIKELKNYLQWTTNYASQKKFDSANKYAKRALVLSKEINDNHLKTLVNYSNARALYWQTNTIEAKELLALNIKNNNIEDSLLYKSIRLMGEIYYYEENYPEAIKQYLSIEKKVRKSKVLSKYDSIVLFKTFISIGLVQAKVKNIDQALIYYDQAKLFAITPEYRNTIVFNKSILYEEENLLRESIKYSLEGVDISIENNFDVWLPSYYKFISNCYLKLGVADSAIYYGKKGLIDNKDCQLEFLYNNIGKGYAIKGNNKKAINYFERALEFSSKLIALEVHESLRDTYIELNDYEKAIYHNQKYLSLKKHVDSLGIRQQLADITEKYESEKNKLEIEILKSKNELNDVVIKEKNNQIVLVSGILLISLVLLIFIFYSYNKQKKHKNLLFIKNRQLAKKLKNNVDTLDYTPQIKIETKDNGKLKIDLEQKERIHNFIKTAIQREFYLDKNISLSEFAKQAGTNTTYLSKVINEDFKKSFAVFINELRISNTLKKLELNPEYRKFTIENIAHKAGFSSSSAFYNAFKNFTGLTPSYYVKKRLLHGNAL